MKEYNIKSGMPVVEIALKRADACIQEAKYKRLKIIKIVHGYGSTGAGGEIKIALHEHLKRKKANNIIQAFIPGEAFTELLGYSELISKYNHLISNDNDARTGNRGITFIIL